MDLPFAYRLGLETVAEKPEVFAVFQLLPINPPMGRKSRNASRSCGACVDNGST